MSACRCVYKNNVCLSHTYFFLFYNSIQYLYLRGFAFLPHRAMHNSSAGGAVAAAEFNFNAYETIAQFVQRCAESVGLPATLTLQPVNANNTLVSVYK